MRLILKYVRYILVDMGKIKENHNLGGAFCKECILKSQIYLAKARCVEESKYLRC